MQFFNILALLAVTAIAVPHNSALEALEVLEGRAVQACGGPHGQSFSPCHRLLLKLFSGGVAIVT